MVLYIDNHWTFCICCSYLDLLLTCSQHQQVPQFSEANAYQGDLSILWLLGVLIGSFNSLSNDLNLQLIRTIVSMFNTWLLHCTQVYNCLVNPFTRVECIKVLTCLHTLQGACVKKLEGKGKVKDSKATKQLVALLSAPLEKYKDVVVVLKLSNYARVMEHLDYETNKVMAVVLIQSVLSNSTTITVPEKVTVLFPVALSCYLQLLLWRFLCNFINLSCCNDEFLSLRLCTCPVLTIKLPFSFVTEGGRSFWTFERAYSR